MKPGVDVISRALPPPRTPPTDISVCFVVGATHAGQTPLPPPVALVHSMTEYVATFGDRLGAGIQTYDAADVFFREGGNELYVSRTNPTSTAASEAREEKEAEEGSKKAAPKPTVVNPGIQTALDALIKGYGPGQVFIADPTLAADPFNQSALLAHCAANNRVGLLTCADGAASVLIAAGTAIQTDANARYGALFAPSAVVPGVVAGTTRTVPYSAVQAGILARNDVTQNPDQPGAGDLGQSLYCLDVAGHYTDQDYANISEASVTAARLLWGGVRTYDNVSCVDQDVNPDWAMFGWARLNMAIVADAMLIGEEFIFQCIDGRGHMLARWGGRLESMLNDYFNADALYGDTPEQAYQVNVGPAVNTPATIAAGELHAVLSVRMSPSPNWVLIEIVKVATNQSLPVAA